MRNSSSRLIRFLAEGGLIVTNAHVVAGATETVRIVLERKKPTPPKMRKGDRVVPWAGVRAKIDLSDRLRRRVREELLKKYEAAKERATKK